MHLLPCLSRWQVRRSMHIQNKLFPQLGRRDVEFWNPCTQQHQRRPAEVDQEIFAAPACPTSICHGEVRTLFGWVPNPPKNVGSSGQQMSWHRIESAFFLRHGDGKRRRSLPSTRACSSWNWNPDAAAPGAVGGRAWVPQIARIPIWGIHGHIQTKTTFICGINGVRGGGGFLAGNLKDWKPHPRHITGPIYYTLYEARMAVLFSGQLTKAGDQSTIVSWQRKVSGCSKNARKSKTSKIGGIQEKAQENMSFQTPAQFSSYLIRNSVLRILLDMYRCSCWRSGYKSRHSNTVFWYTTYLIRKKKQGYRNVRSKPCSVQNFVDVLCNTTLAIELRHTQLCALRSLKSGSNCKQSKTRTNSPAEQWSMQFCDPSMFTA